MCVSGGLDGDGGVVVLEMGSFVAAVKYLLSRKRLVAFKFSPVVRL